MRIIGPLIRYCVTNPAIRGEKKMRVLGKKLVNYKIYVSKVFPGVLFTIARKIERCRCRFYVFVYFSISDFHAYLMISQFLFNRWKMPAAESGHCDDADGYRQCSGALPYGDDDIPPAIRNRYVDYGKKRPFSAGYQS